MERRTFVKSMSAASGVGLAAFAGCTEVISDVTDNASTTTTEQYDYLERTRVYVTPDVSLTVPSDVPRAEGPADADLVILPGTPDVSTETVIEWFAAGTGVALVGADAQTTFLEWQKSDAYRETFEKPHGSSSASPRPDLLVAFAVEREYVTTHRFTWGDDDPTETELLAALDDALRDEATSETH